MKKINIILFVIAGIIAIANLMQGQTITQDTAWYKNHTVMQLTIYTDGMRTERCVYYPTGELQLYQEFDPTTGNQSNDEFWYYRNGQVQHAAEFVQGYAHGWAFTWDEVGNCTKTEVYVENVLIPTDQHNKYFPDRVVDSDDVFTAGFAARR